LITVIIIGLAIASAAVATAFAQASMQGRLPENFSCTNETIFDSFSKDSSLGHDFAYGIQSTYLSNEGTMAYLYEDFSGYAENQHIIDEFEAPASWSVNTEIGKLQAIDEYYGGAGALAYMVPPDMGREITLSKIIGSFDADRWSTSGYITMWIKVTNRDGIDSVTIVFEDNQGNKRVYTPLENVHTDAPNTFANDLEYPDLVYPEGDPNRDMWVDFVIENGWNYLLWRADMYNDSDNRVVDMSNIEKVHVQLQVNDRLVGHTLIFDDLRIQDGLQRFSNPTGGAWHPPHGRPQYGVYDIDRKDDDTGYELRLLNVRNTQYPSNGDHARMISASPVPVDFVMRVKFTFIQLGREDETLVLPTPFPAWMPPDIRELQVSKGQRDNTYFRITYDFEPSWDPGHEWYGAYTSLQYNRFGIMSVWPVERNILQDQEPPAGARTASTEFVAQEGVQYEMHLLAKGQFLSATMYEVRDSNHNGNGKGNGNGNDECLERKTGTSYVFEQKRHGSDKRYPLAIESTGSMRSIIHEVELISLENLNPDEIYRTSPTG
jgi:hypothetical protein